MILVRNTTFEDACRVAKAHPGSVLTADGFGHTVRLGTSDPTCGPGKAGSPSREGLVAKKRGGSKRLFRRTRAHKNAVAKVPKPAVKVQQRGVGAALPIGPRTVVAVVGEDICPHGGSARLCDYCWQQGKGGSLD